METEERQTWIKRWNDAVTRVFAGMDDTCYDLLITVAAPASCIATKPLPACGLLCSKPDRQVASSAAQVVVAVSAISTGVQNR